tara:strand:- start:15 stop:515 length:501 start_codon:yes stop_codon:yes gene_type:complete
MHVAHRLCAAAKAKNKATKVAEDELSDVKTLRLMAVDADDLQVISAACQDGVCKPADLSFEKAKRRFHIEFNRYRWENTSGQRVRSALSFEDVTSVKARALPPKSADLVLSILSVEWTPDEEAPAGKVRVLFAGDGELELTMDCLDATLVDVSNPWSTRNRPTHKD